MNPQQPHVPAAASPSSLCARLLWAERSWRCFLAHGCVRLYSGGKRLLTHPVQSAGEGEQVAELWQRSIRRIADLSAEQASAQY